MRPLFAFSALALAACSSSKAPQISVENGWARATVVGQSSAAAYLTIINRGGADDWLISVSVPRAGMAMLHSSSMDNGVMHMRGLNDGLAIPAGATVTLAPNGMHIMLTGIKTPLHAGEQLPATIRFAKAGAKDIAIQVRDASAQ